MGTAAPTPQQTELTTLVVNGIRELHKLLRVSKDFKKPDAELIAYDVAHHAGQICVWQEALLDLAAHSVDIHIRMRIRGFSFDHAILQQDCFIEHAVLAAGGQVRD